MMLLYILCATLVSPLVTVKAEYCYAEDKDPYIKFSTYTPYEFVHENRSDPVNIPREY